MKYKFWEGEQLYYADGKIQFGVNLWQPICTFLIINIIQLLLCFNTIRDLKNVDSGYTIYLYIGLFLTFGTSVLLVLTATKDPATIPMRDFLVRAYKNKLDHSTLHSLERRKYLAVHGPFLTKMKYC